MLNPSFQLIRTKSLELSLGQHFTSNLSANSVGSTFKVYLESHHFLPFSPLPLWSTLPSPLAWIIARASNLAHPQMFTLETSPRVTFEKYKWDHVMPWLKTKQNKQNKNLSMFSHLTCGKNQNSYNKYPSLYYLASRNPSLKCSSFIIHLAHSFTTSGLC